MRPRRQRLERRAVSTSGPSSVTAIVCSKCADERPVGRDDGPPVGELIRVSSPPSVSIGSTATTSPGRRSGPRPARAPVLDERVLVQRPADPVPAVLAHDAEARRLGHRLDRVADVGEPPTRLDRRDRGVEARLGRPSRAARPPPRARSPPTNTVTAESEWNPSQIAPKSRESRSPSREHPRRATGSRARSRRSSRRRSSSGEAPVAQEGGDRPCVPDVRRSATRVEVSRGHARARPPRPRPRSCSAVISPERRILSQLLGGLPDDHSTPSSSASIRSVTSSSRRLRVDLRAAGPASW